MDHEERKKEIQLHIEWLVQYGVSNGLIEGLDKIVCRNGLLAVFGLSEPMIVDPQNTTWQETVPSEVTDILEPLLDDAVAVGLLTENITAYRDQLESKIMAILTPSQTQLQRNFAQTKQVAGIEKATDYFYHFSKATNYIKVKRIEKNILWTAETDYGALQITINLSKPEKDPKEIAMAREKKETNYPKCLLCLENIGFAGNINHPPRYNHRVIPVHLSDETWYFQYSPYLYYNEHCIVFHRHHTPMTITDKTFERLLDFVDQFPHYFIGSNADLPIVGGSILAHDHFQGGQHTFPMATAPVERSFKSARYPNITIGVVQWPMSVLRLCGTDKKDLVGYASEILTKWRQYSDSGVDILSHTGETPHNTITPIARKKGNQYEMDLVLRNNRTTDQYPDGIFHPHQELHHIKKENIGLIEVMGLAILPERLEKEVRSGALSKTEINQKFEQVLMHAGVFKRDTQGQKAFDAFVHSIL